MVVVDCGGETESGGNFVDEIFAEIDGRILVEPVAKVHEIRPVKFHRAEISLVEQDEKRQGGIFAFEVENAEGVVNAAVVLVESFGERIVVADEIAFGSPALFDGNRDVAAGAGVVDSGGDFVETENVGENVADRSFAGARFAVENGITDAAHTPGDKEMEDDLIAMMVEKHISMNTTVGNMAAPLRFLPKGYKDEAELRQNQQNMLNNLKRFYDAGGLIVTGTDRQDRDGSGGNTQIPVWEMQQLLNAGIPFKEVIKTATLNGALLCGRNDEGLIEEGMKANLIAFKGKMDNSFSQLLDLKFVMHEGTILKHETGFVHALENIS